MRVILAVKVKASSRFAHDGGAGHQLSQVVTGSSRLLNGSIGLGCAKRYDGWVPKVFEVNGFKFFFYSNEGEPPEPAHIHVRKNEAVAKFWLAPTVRLASSWGFKPKELNWIEGVASDERDRFLGAWDEYFG